MKQSNRMQENPRQEYTLEALMREYGDDVLRMAFLYVKDMHTAEDMFQETFIKVNEKLASFEGRSGIKTWILSIAMNTCRDYLKSVYHRKVVPLYDFAEEQLSSEADFENIEKEEQAKTVREAVQALPEHYREVVLCVYFRQMSVEQTAGELAISSGTVKSRLSRAREQLKKLLERRLSYEG